MALSVAFGWAAPVRAQTPDIHAMSGIPRPVTDVPDGTVVVRVVRGSFSNNAAGQPVTLQSSTQSKTATTDDQGRASFIGFTAGSTVHASTDLDGEKLTSEEFPVPEKGGARLLLVGQASDAAAASAKAVPGHVIFGGQSRVVIDPGDGDIQLFYLLDIINNEATPVMPPSTLIIDMPAEGQGTALLQGSTPQAVVKGNRVTVPGPFQPGETVVEAGTVLTYDTGELKITQTFPADLLQIAVVARKIGNLSLSSPQLSNTRELTNKGETYVAGTGPEVKAGQTITLTLSGLPFHSRFPVHLALAFAVLIVLIGIVAIVTARNTRGNEARVQRLAEQRERLFADLVRLEEQKASGAVSPERYAVKRGELLARLERVYGQLEDESSTGDQGLAA